MGYTQNVCGYARLSTSGAVGDSGKPIAIAGYSVFSSSTAAVPYMLNGGASGALAWRLPGTASIAVESSKPIPVMLPNGCYVSFDANTTEVSVYYYQQSVTS